MVDASLIDLLGHVNNVRWLELLVQLAVDHSIALGFDFDRLRMLGGHWVVQRHVIEYLSPAVCGQELWEQTWVAALGAATCDRRYRILDRQSGRVCVQGASIWVFTTDQGRVRRLPGEVRKGYPIFEGEYNETK